ncbi:putative MFS monocarboxylate transporter [Xylona heveae TC161]|uniref:Putative MFS monocarboxylate transporter n=1 Tax=Xylona heveae (strain CBS 132557 / TC161) TaxID=1328760 RepID=A0A165HXQ4_XYLHT|nr:putative MFS monocarboxylate transporter [Xylona heveae TC161]KZF24072.1 putative MFS monocarboxylate transporter [Xylona heveae TC161]
MTSINESFELNRSPSTRTNDNVIDRASFEMDSPDQQSNTEIEQPALPEADGGKSAWLMLVGCSIIQLPIWGFSITFGVFQEYYATHDDFRGNKSSIAVIGTTATGLLYLLSPFTFTLLSRYPWLRRHCGPLGLFVTTASFLLSSFATELWQLIATQGVMNAVGSAMLFTTPTLYLDEWFVRRKGLAYGVMGSAKSAVGFALPLAVNASLNRFGLQKTLWAWCVGLVAVTSPLLFVIKPRLPLSPNSAPRSLNLNFMRMSSFWALQIGNLLQSLGYFLPSTYLSSYSNAIGLSTTIGTVEIAVLNGTSVFGSSLIGLLCDSFQVTNVILISTAGSAIAVFLFWGLSSQVSLLTIFAITFGFFAGGFSSTWSGAVGALKQEEPALDTGFVYGLFTGTRGIGNVISGPLSVAMLNSQAVTRGPNRGYNTQYGPIILFSGVTALLGSWSWIWHNAKLLHARLA